MFEIANMTRSMSIPYSTLYIYPLSFYQIFHFWLPINVISLVMHSNLELHIIMLEARWHIHVVVLILYFDSTAIRDLTWLSFLTSRTSIAQYTDVIYNISLTSHCHHISMFSCYSSSSRCILNHPQAQQVWSLSLPPSYLFFSLITSFFKW